MLIAKHSKDNINCLGPGVAQMENPALIPLRDPPHGHPQLTPEKIIVVGPGPLILQLIAVGGGYALLASENVICHHNLVVLRLPRVQEFRDLLSVGLCPCGMPCLLQDHCLKDNETLGVTLLLADPPAFAASSHTNHQSNFTPSSLHWKEEITARYR